MKTSTRMQEGTLRDMKDNEHELYETETMAELCARQGRLHEAIAIFRRLIDTHPGSDSSGRWADRLGILERAWGHAAGEEIEPDELPFPAAPGVAVSATEESVTVAWALAPATREPTLELLLIQRTPSGVETTKRNFRLDGATGRLAFAVPALHTALAAVGQTRGDRFVPLARSARG